jgi:rare lipoprotein A
VEIHLHGRVDHRGVVPGRPSLGWSFQSGSPGADHRVVPSAWRTPLTAALLVAVVGLPAGPAGAAGSRTALPAAAAPAAAAPSGAADLARLERALETAAAQALALSDALDQQAARDGGLRIALSRLEEQHDAARARLDARVRTVWIRRTPDPLGGWVEGLTAPSLRRLAATGAGAAVRVDRELVDAVADQSQAAADLRARSAAFREQLRGQAEQALQAQERARLLLDQAEVLVAERAAAADRAEAQQRLITVRASLDRASATTTTALTPAQTRRSAGAQVKEAPVLALVEAAGTGYPEGYAPTGEVLAGLASWYGPGFVGKPTASGAPYDPERLSCAHKTLRLGTVVRVSANGTSVSCLVNDRGPYVGPRILDMSRAGSRALGYDGVQQVTIEVLAPQ